MEDQKADTQDHPEAILDKTANQGGRPGAMAKAGSGSPKAKVGTNRKA